MKDDFSKKNIIFKFTEYANVDLIQYKE